MHHALVPVSSLQVIYIELFASWANKILARFVFQSVLKKNWELVKQTIADVCQIAHSACQNTNAIIPVPIGDEGGHV